MDESAFTYADPADPLLKRLAIAALEVATGRNRIKRLYLQHQATGWAGASFFDVAIKALSLDLRYDADRLAALPKEGPLVVVSNHPFGVLDGIVMCALMRRARPDFLVLTNAVLLRAPEMRAHMLPIDFTETMEAQRANVASRTKALKHLQNGGCVVIFPAGAVSTSPDRLGRRPAVDPPWTPYVARLVQSAQAPAPDRRAFRCADRRDDQLRPVGAADGSEGADASLAGRNLCTLEVKAFDAESAAPICRRLNLWLKNVLTSRVSADGGRVEVRKADIFFFGDDELHERSGARQRHDAASDCRLSGIRRRASG